MANSPAEDCCSGHACCEASADGCGTTSQAGSPDDCCGALSKPAATTLAKAPPLLSPDLTSRQTSLELPTSSPLQQADLACDPAPPPDDGLYTLYASFLI